MIDKLKKKTEMWNSWAYFSQTNIIVIKDNGGSSW